ncbi:Enoyl-(Acyl carrier protein) reductase [Ceratobasidium sp. AG-Ba]|nr:Enoyl-(Acyl carrier protein) reductase [Ceratobasidium sp. AG-Ba]
MSSTLTLLNGKKILIIGGSSGIGRAVAAASLALGASVVIASSRKPKVDAAIELLKKDIEGKAGVAVSGQVVDVRDFKSVTEFLTKEAPFDHLVITAGEIAGGFPKPPESGVDLKQTDITMDMRYWPFMNAANHIHRNNLIRPGGSIVVTIGSVQSRPMPGFAYFTGVLGAVATATRGLALDLKPMRVNAIAPGLVNTDIFRDFAPEVVNHIMETSRQKLPVGHVGTAEELAEAYIFAMKASKLHDTSRWKLNLTF